MVSLSTLNETDANMHSCVT